MSDVFSAQADAFRASMVGTGGVASAVAPKESCGDCNEARPCLHCGGNVDHASPAYQALEWGMLMAEHTSDPLQRIAEVGHAVANAPARDGSAEWGAVDQIIRNTHAFHLLTTQGQNVLSSISELLMGDSRDDPVATGLLAEDDDGMGGGNSVLSGGAGPAGGPAGGGVAADDDGGMGGGNKVPGMGDGNPKVPAMGEPETATGYKEECCCVAKDIKIDEIQHALIRSKNFFYIHVHPIVAKGVGKPKSCTLDWEEMPSNTYDPGGGNVPAGAFTNLNNHPSFKGRPENKAKPKEKPIKGMAARALEALQKFPCPEKEIPEIYDTPNMGRASTLIIRITLKSGCDSSKIVKYILLLAPTSIAAPVLEGPYVVGENDLIGGALMKTIYDATPHRSS